MEQGYGIGMIPICGFGARSRHLTRVMAEMQHQEALYLVAHQDLKRSARIRAVFDYLVEAFRQDSAFFSQGGESVFSPGRFDIAPPSACRETRDHTHLTVAAE
jgi:hypothetical protein